MHTTKCVEGEIVELGARQRDKHTAAKQHHDIGGENAERLDIFGENFIMVDRNRPLCHDLLKPILDPLELILRQERNW